MITPGQGPLPSVVISLASMAPSLAGIETSRLGMAGHPLVGCLGHIRPPDGECRRFSGGGDRSLAAALDRRAEPQCLAIFGDCAPGDVEPALVEQLDQPV